MQLSIECSQVSFLEKFFSNQEVRVKKFERLIVPTVAIL